MERHRRRQLSTVAALGSVLRGDVVESFAGAIRLDNLAYKMGLSLRRFTWLALKLAQGAFLQATDRKREQP